MGHQKTPKKERYQKIIQIRIIMGTNKLIKTAQKFSSTKKKQNKKH